MMYIKLFLILFTTLLGACGGQQGSDSGEPSARDEQDNTAFLDQLENRTPLEYSGAQSTKIFEIELDFVEELDLATSKIHIYIDHDQSSNISSGDFRISLSKYSESVRWYSSEKFYSTDARGFDWAYQNKRLIIGLDRLLSSDTSKDLKENQPYFQVMVEKLSTNNGQESVIGYDVFPAVDSYSSSVNKFVLDDSLDYSENGRDVDLRAIRLFNHLYNPRVPHPSSELPVVEYQNPEDKQIWLQFEIDFADDIDLDTLDLVVNVNALGLDQPQSFGDFQISLSQSIARIKWQPWYGYGEDLIETEEGLIWGVKGNRLILGLDGGLLSYSRYRLAEEEMRFSILASPIGGSIKPGISQDKFPDLSRSANFSSFYESDNVSDQTGDNNSVDITAVRATNFVPVLVSANAEDSIEAIIKAVDQDQDGITNEYDHFPLDVLRSSDSTNYVLQPNGTSVCINKACIRLSTSEEIYERFSYQVYSDIESTAEFVPGGSFSCTLESSKINCEGSNIWGQLDVPELENPTHIAVGGTHACAKTNLGVKCWGDSDRHTRPPSNLSEVKKLVAGKYYSCALLTTGGVRCWGDEGFIEPFWIANSSRFTELFSSDFAICALDGQATPYCWGWNSYHDFIPDNLSDVTKLALGNEHACALYKSGEMECWGNNKYGQASVPEDIVAPQSIVVDHNYTCAQTKELLRCWGAYPYTDKAMNVYLGAVDRKLKFIDIR